MTDYVVIIPTRNRYTDCLRAIRSAFAQTLPPAEVVVVDDASTDARYENSTAIVRAAVARKLGKQRPSGFGEDHDYWRRAAILSPVFRLDEPLAFYTIGNPKEYSL